MKIDIKRLEDNGYSVHTYDVDGRGCTHTENIVSIEIVGDGPKSMYEASEAIYKGLEVDYPHVDTDILRGVAAQTIEKAQAYDIVRICNR